jgi:hypothetical protein
VPNRSTCINFAFIIDFYSFWYTDTVTFDMVAIFTIHTSQ